MSGPHEPLPESPDGLAAKVRELLAQSRHYQEGMEKICEDLQRLQVRLATLGNAGDEKKDRK